MEKSLEEWIKEIRSDIGQPTRNDFWILPQYEIKEETYPEILFPIGPHSIGLETIKREQRDEMRRKKQKKICELMSMYQAYHTLLWLKQEENYATRGSVIKCQYGTRSDQLDCLMDHGVIMGNLPVMTCTDCGSTNIHNFGSCMCPENRYRGRLPMTVSVHPNGQPAKKLTGNEYAHICVPMITEPWLQSEGKIEIVDKEVVAHALLKEASLTCLYGGRIRIEEVPRQEEPPEDNKEQDQNLLYTLSKEYKQWLFMAEGRKFFPYIDPADNDEAKENKNVTISPGITFDKNKTHWGVLEKKLGWTEEDITTIIHELYDLKIKYNAESKYAITEDKALEVFEKLAKTEYIPNLNYAIQGYRTNHNANETYTQRELEAMFDFSYNNGLSPVETCVYLTEDGSVQQYSPLAENPKYIIFYYLRKQKSAAVEAVKTYGDVNSRRRINQMYLFFEGYDFVEVNDSKFSEHKKTLGF